MSREWVTASFAAAAAGALILVGSTMVASETPARADLANQTVKAHQTVKAEGLIDDSQKPGTAECPDGFYPTGGGYDLVSYYGALVVRFNSPSRNNTGWTVLITSPAHNKGKFVVYAMCTSVA